jgi:DNA polymerase epsilon subunit 1
MNDALRLHGRPIIAANKKRVAQEDTALSGWLSIYGDGATVANRDAMDLDPLAWVVDLREFDVPYTMRVAIDMDLRVGAWYIVKLTQVRPQEPVVIRSIFLIFNSL